MCGEVVENNHAFAVPEKEKIYSRQVSAPILKRKTSRFGLGQFLGSSSGNQNTSTASHSVATTSITLHTRSKPPPPCPVHHSQHTAFPYQPTQHQHPHTHAHPHPHPHAHPSQHHPHSHPQYAGSSAQVATFASAHSQSHQYLVHCVPPSHHSPMPTLQEAETLLRAQAAQQTASVQSNMASTQQQGAVQSRPIQTTVVATTSGTATSGSSSVGAASGHAFATSFHSHFQKHPSAPNLLPLQPPVAAPSPSPSALAYPMHCTCDVAPHPGANIAGTTGSTTVNPGRL